MQAAFARAGRSTDDAFDAALIISELVGNSVKHAQPLPSGQLAVEWVLETDGYLLSVTDGGGHTAIEPQVVNGYETGGRGLLIVATLARSWGLTEQESSTTVWARGTFQQLGATRDGALQASR